jgi:hypothetical protein
LHFGSKPVVPAWAARSSHLCNPPPPLRRKVRPRLRRDHDVIRWNIAGQYGRVWQTLHPRYQQVVSQSFWTACKRRIAAKSVGLVVRDFRVTGSRPATITLPLLGRLHVTAVRASLTFRYQGQTQTVTQTNYYVKVGGAWKGFWTLGDFRAYQAHRCPV